MKYRFKRPELIPSIVMLVVVALMFSLGAWQLKRLAWKTALLAKIEAAQSEAPKDLLSYPADQLPEAEWHNVLVKGTLLNDKELYATPRYLNGVMGYAVLTPLKVSTPKGPVYALINRGWVSREMKDENTRMEGNPKKPVAVAGIIRGSFKKGMFVPENNPQKNIWFWYDLPAMSQQLHLPLLPILIDATQLELANGQAIKGGPTPFPLEITIRNDHLGYAITWFLIGIAGMVMFGIYYLEPKQE